MIKILVIDDEAAIRRTLKEILEYEKYKVELAENGEEGWKMINEESYDVVLCDIKMPKMDGIQLLQKVVKEFDVPFIMISGHGDIDTAVDSIKMGAFDFIQKPIDLSRLQVSVKNALDKSNLVKETKVLKKKVDDKYEMIGESDQIKEVKQIIDKVAPTPARVLITGENGTGKELVAHWIHQKSERSHAPFIEVNCAAIPSELIESQLFGHEKGSFTSAHKKKIGDFELANGGSIFLDEIGDMSASAQAKVLRALQENKITRVGGEKEISVDVRVIAATNKNLKEEIENGTFREDLFHRLSVIPVNVPPLRDRVDDIPLLVEHFSKSIASQQGSKAIVFEDEAVKELQKRNWTGNIRELRNVVERLLILCSGTVTKADIEKYVY